MSSLSNYFYEQQKNLDEIMQANIDNYTKMTLNNLSASFEYKMNKLCTAHKMEIEAKITAMDKKNEENSEKVEKIWRLKQRISNLTNFYNSSSNFEDRATCLRCINQFENELKELSMQ
jgi:hypothetical protein